MKRILTIIILSLFLCVGLSACKPDAQENGPTVVTTNFAVYDWSQAILGENPSDITVHLLSRSGTDLHSYQPTARDMLQIQSASLFLYVGGETESWVPSVLQITNANALALTEILNEDLLCSHREDHHEDHTYDEHVWLSISNAKKVCRALAEQLSRIDPANEKHYQQNLEDYLQKLDALDMGFANAIAQRQKPGVVFGDRFPFLYLMSDYELPYEAAFDGCSAESDASFTTISRLAQKVDAWDLNVIFVTENSIPGVADAIIGATKEKNQQVLTLNAMQSVTARDLAEGCTYLQIMEENLAVLQQGLQ